MVTRAPRLIGFGLLVSLAMVLQLEQRPAFASGGAEPPPGATAAAVRFPCPEAPRPGGTEWPIERDLRPRGHEHVVPVVLHMMHNAACARDPENCRRLCPTNTPSCEWSPERVSQQFAREGGINNIWQTAGVRLAVVAVRQCAYDPTEFHQDRDAIAPGIPPNTAALWAVAGGRGQRYDAVNRRFGVDDALNVFLWLQTTPSGDTSITYFGSSPRHPLVGEPKRPIVWADSLCVAVAPERGDAQKFTPAECSRKLAHEVGHALTLRHIDEPNAQGAPTGAEFQSCRGRNTTEANALALNLMRQNPKRQGRDVDPEEIPEHRKLTQWQQCQAMNAAAAFFKPWRFTH